MTTPHFLGNVNTSKIHLLWCTQKVHLCYELSLTNSVHSGVLRHSRMDECSTKLNTGTSEYQVWRLWQGLLRSSCPYQITSTLGENLQTDKEVFDMFTAEAFGDRYQGITEIQYSKDKQVPQSFVVTCRCMLDRICSLSGLHSTAPSLLKRLCDLLMWHLAKWL